MKFITEMELRDLYKTEPFTNYVLEVDTKITPGARQFLADRRVTLGQAQCGEGKKATIDESKQVVQGSENWCTLGLRRRMECIESLFLLIAAELLHSGDAALSEEVMALGKCFKSIQNAEQAKIAPDKPQFGGWSEEEINKRSEDLDSTVGISEFHVRLENGKEIALLNHLRASLREVEPALLEVYWNEEKQACARQDLIDANNLIINILCILLWKCLGGQKWKR